MTAPRPPNVITRIRPVSVRFTDAGIADFEAELRGKPVLLEDELSEEEHGATIFDATAGRERRAELPQYVEEELARILSEEEDIVRIFKQKIREARPSLAHRRLRLIHAGRILKDGIKLVSWLDSLDAHRSAQERAAKISASTGLNALGENARAALGGLREAAERSGTLDLDRLTKRGRQFLRGLDQEGQGDVEADAGAGAGTLSAKAKGKARLIDDEAVDDATAGWESSAGQGYVPIKTVEDRSAERVYIQCSIGDEMTAEEEAEANAPRTAAVPPLLRSRPNPWAPNPGSDPQYDSSSIHSRVNPPPVVVSPWADPDEDPFQTSTHAQQAGDAEGTTDQAEGAPRGFDRLAATAGLSTADIEEMRSQFRLAAARGWGDGGAQPGVGSSGLGRSGDVLREAEEEEHARALEEQWIDSMGEGMEGDANRTGSGPLNARFQGLFVGFFFPFLPLFFWRDKTGHPARLPRNEYVYDPQRPGEVIRADELDYDSEDDEEGLGRNGQGGGMGPNPANAIADARNVVFTSTMAQAIIVGLVCNFAYGALASLW
ncbi:hypothetical protein OC846_003876 [Tilletia horrida]|uniref:Ubiquitin-like domain-containing protein n=1 Tax=Tilletia horrida TaxID=155126 RepID=A0AAN6GRE9_9BASI|nr:hypothetical protein OC846_003876 [Tilletia horrida]KAK0565036.1 hypothetical protein OC861_003961 [Tilletia horrida]